MFGIQGVDIVMPDGGPSASCFGLALVLLRERNNGYGRRQTTCRARISLVLQQECLVA